MAKQIVKDVQIIARYQFKADPRKVCYLVRSSNGKDSYMTCLFDGKATSCECPSRKPCRHQKQVEQVERERVARKENELLLAKIEAETLSQIEEELAVVPAIGKSEQARLAELPLSEDELRDVEQFHAWQEELDDEKRYSRWSKQECEAADRAAYVAMFDPCGLAS